MSAKGVLLRYQLIIDKIRQQKYVSLTELVEYIQNKIEYFADDVDNYIGISRRTILRDIKNIKNIFGISIAYSKNYNGYYIEESLSITEGFENLLNNFVINRYVHTFNKLYRYVVFEENPAKNYEVFFDILYALRHNLKVSFKYNSYSENKISDVVAIPYGLKEFATRWYLLAEHTDTKKLKTYALERIYDFSVLNEPCTNKKQINVKNYFANSFGIFVLEDEKPIDVVLSFSPLQGRFVKSKPLHSSQIILKDTDEELIVKLHIQNTFDFRKELLSYGAAVKVLEPEILKKQLIEEYQKCLAQYKKLQNTQKMNLYHTSYEKDQNI